MARLSPEEWRRVNDLFHQALDLEEAARAAFLVDATREFPHLRAEVESLLASYLQSADFMEKPAAAQFADSLQNPFSTPTFHSGDQLGDFVIQRSLGAGAFATVYLAQQTSLSRPVALKISPDFGDEARTMASLEHQHIMKVFSETHDPISHTRLLCMQYVPGTSLARILETHPAERELTGAELLKQVDAQQSGETLFDPAALKDRERLQGLDSVDTVGWIGLRLASALSYAHECGVLHLDVKPGNILINCYGQPMLTDFNVAVRSRALEERKQTILGGTLDYMAPEHKRIFQGSHATERIDQRADIYSLGLVLKEMLAKSEPFHGAREIDGLRDILACCLREDPRQRFTSVAKLVRALEGFLELRSIEKALPPPGAISRLTLEHPTLSFTIFTLLPQVLGSIVNISYNAIRIVSELSTRQQQLFRSLVVIYNLAVYPVCTGLLILLILPIVRMLWSPPRSYENPAEAKRLRRHVLQLPLRTAAVAVLGWMPGAIFFPLALDWLEGPLPPGVYEHFFISFTLSCLIAMTYSFLYIQFISLRVLYPRLCSGEIFIRETAKAELRRVAPTMRIFHFSAGLVPLAGAALVVAFGPEKLDPQHYQIYRWLVSFLLFSATCGIFAAVRATQLLSQCLFALTGSG